MIMLISKRSFLHLIMVDKIENEKANLLKAVRAYKKGSDIFKEALCEEIANPVKYELFKAGVYNFTKLYFNKHKNENIYIKIK